MVELRSAGGPDRLGPLRGGGADCSCRDAAAVATFGAALQKALAAIDPLDAAFGLDHGQRPRLAPIATLGNSDDFVSHSDIPLLGEWVGAERVAAIAVGFLGVAIATRPGTAAFQPIVLVAVAGVLCNSGYVLATRRLAAADAPQTTLAWTQIAGIVFLTPLLPWVWRHPATVQVWLVMAAMGAFGAGGHALLIVAHRFAPAPALTPFSYTQLLWMIVSGALVFGDWPSPETLIGATLVVACGAYLALRERRGRRARGIQRSTSVGETS